MLQNKVSDQDLQFANSSAIFLYEYLNLIASLSKIEIWLFQCIYSVGRIIPKSICPNIWKSVWLHVLCNLSKNAKWMANSVGPDQTVWPSGLLSRLQIMRSTRDGIQLVTVQSYITELFIITPSSSWQDLNNVERDIKHCTQPLTIVWSGSSLLA